MSVDAVLYDLRDLLSAELPPGRRRLIERTIAEIERLRAERNLAVEILQSAERELAAELERCAQLRDAAQGLLSAVGYDRKDMIDEAADKLAAELAAERAARIAVASSVRQEGEP